MIAKTRFNIGVSDQIRPEYGNCTIQVEEHETTFIIEGFGTVLNEELDIWQESEIYNRFSLPNDMIGMVRTHFNQNIGAYIVDVAGYELTTFLDKHEADKVHDFLILSFEKWVKLEEKKGLKKSLSK